MVTCTGDIGIHEGADGRTDVDDVMAIKPNFLTSMGYHIFLTMVLRARAFGARGAPLLTTSYPGHFSLALGGTSHPKPGKSSLGTRLRLLIGCFVCLKLGAVFTAPFIPMQTLKFNFQPMVSLFTAANRVYSNKGH